ncbi:MAG: hypothetical protein H7Y38_10190 [Armatimonadetes bacterium]|nr:hypothetical protein [Armatimonadota bacterium]
MNENTNRAEISPTEVEIIDSEVESKDAKKSVLIASIITAAVVSAATAGYIVWRKTQAQQKSGEDVQHLLDKAHKTLHILEDRLDDLRSSVARSKKTDTGTAMA